VDLAKKTNISSPKRKVGPFGEDPIAETINQLREEPLRQLRQEREIREREISQMSLLPQKVTEDNAVIASSATKIPGISRSSGEGAGNNGNPVPIASPRPLASTQAASEAAESSEGAEPPGEKFTVTGRLPVTLGIPTPDPSPSRILVEDGSSGEEEVGGAVRSEDERRHIGAQGINAPVTDSVATPTFRRTQPPQLRDVATYRPVINNWERDEDDDDGTDMAAQGNTPKTAATRSERPRQQSANRVSNAAAMRARNPDKAASLGEGIAKPDAAKPSSLPELPTWPSSAKVGASKAPEDRVSRGEGLSRTTPNLLLSTQTTSGAGQLRQQPAKAAPAQAIVPSRFAKQEPKTHDARVAILLQSG
jgi:hypothetical protein